MKQLIDKQWELYNDAGIRIQANVPGDITADLFRAGQIDDPFWGMNHKETGWITDTDFTYQTSFDVDWDLWNSEEICLTFDGIDLFAEIYLNGQLIGSTENMFLQYQYDVKGIVKKEGNLLQIKMLSTKRKMNEIDTGDCWGIFNTERLFLRKAQCHFGWDWAPNMPGYGIYKSVWIEGRSKNRICDISYQAYNNGKICFSVEVNYDIRPWTDHYGKPLQEIPECVKGDRLVYKVATRPNEGLDTNHYAEYEQKVQGTRQFANFKLDEPELWWPAGYGEQPLYAYSVELIRGEKVLDKKEGKFAFRQVRMDQQPISAERLECKIVVNDMPIFAKGSNWVPMECFTGEMKTEKYERLLSLAKSGHMNILRVWGGGIYEDDAFYEICDNLGIMVWQDMMFACADIPEDRPEFIENVKQEIAYQIRRLRSHPSIVVWSGGNEKVGSLCKQVSHGDFFQDVILHGMISSLDSTRPIVKQSPFGMNELANDTVSGDTHISAFEASLEAGVEKYRDILSKNMASFVSECSIMGPGSVESYRKMFPQEKLWPMNEYWDARLMDNPYAEVPVTFADRQRIFASALYEESTSLEAFVAKGMTVHAEALRAEIEYARSNKGNTWGFMNWMYSDSWPSGTWSVVDYYCEPKQAYYQMKRSFEPVLATFTQNYTGKTVLCVVNDTKEDISGTLEYGLKSLDGKVFWSHETEVSVMENGVYWQEITDDFRQDNTYLYVKGMLNGQKISNVYAENMWKGYSFESDYTYHVEEMQDKMVVTVKANQFVKGIILKLPENEKYIYSDNYFDLEAGEEKTILIEGCKDTSADKLTVTDFARETR